jgi:peptidyl-prolyl cis-trans isomerase A (cyclophilin A)
MKFSLVNNNLYLLALLAALFLVASPQVAATAKEETTAVEFEVQIAPGKSASFTVEVHPEWAPLGAARFLELVEEGDTFWKGIRFFRVIEDFMAQFGIPGKPELAAEWREKSINDDPVVKSNERGFLSFATSGKDSRTTQMFINLVNNANLDGMGFAPFATVTGDGMDVVDQLYSGYGEGAPGGNGPDQGRIQSEGNKYLKKQFPNLSYVKSVKRVDSADMPEEL